jgi:hypothetical protein
MTWSIFFFSRKKKKNKTLDNDDGDNRPKPNSPEPGLVTVTILEHLSLLSVCVQIFRNTFGFFFFNVAPKFSHAEKIQQPGQIERRKEQTTKISRQDRKDCSINNK